MADASVPQNLGGQYNALFTGGEQNALIYTGAGRLCKLHITTAGTAVFTIYDGTQSTGGTMIYKSITNDVTGTSKDLQIPFTTGLAVVGTTGSAGFSLCYNKTGAFGI